MPSTARRLNDWTLVALGGLIAVLNLEVNGHTWKEILLSAAIVALVGMVKWKIRKKEKP